MNSEIHPLLSNNNSNDSGNQNNLTSRSSHISRNPGMRNNYSNVMDSQSDLLEHEQQQLLSALDKNEAHRIVNENVEKELLGSRMRPKAGYGTIIYAVIEVVAVSVMLALYHEETCQDSLETWLLLNLILRSFISIIIILTRIISSETSARNLKKVQSLLNLAGFVLFIYGNIYVFSSSDCATNAPHLY